MQSKNVKGAIITGEFTGELKFYAPYYGTTAFSSEEIHGVNYESYEGSIVEGYVNDYKNLLEGKFDLKIEEARLISMEELVAENIGCTVRLVGTTDLEIKCTKAPSFIYSTSYWFNYSENSNYGITNLAGAFYAPYDNDYIFGVRPVIVISKDYF